MFPVDLSTKNNEQNKMLLIDKPYISNFLIDTIKSNNFPIIATTVAQNLILDTSLNWISEKEAKELFIKNPQQKLYSNSENSISWIEKNLGTTLLPNQINIFKNKIKFRDLLKAIFPNYFYLGVKFEDLDKIDTDKLPFPLIIKPAVGFFSLGVHKVEIIEEWQQVILKIKNDISEINGFYPKEVLNTSNFIIEDCILGEEYAIDSYFDSEGKPVVLNILHHIFSSGKDVSDRVYTTSRMIIEEHLGNIENFLNNISNKAKLKNFPLHVEVRIDESGIVNPIEVNPMRFGGWCTTADLTWHAYGINSYEYFLKELKPDWNNIFKVRKDKLYSIVVFDNNSGFKENEIESFDYDLALKDFENPLELRKIDINSYPVFGFLFTETSYENKKELNQILTSNLIKYIKLKRNY